MSVYSNEIGTYVDPGMISPDNIIIVPGEGSSEGWEEGCSIVPLPDGRNAIVNSDGIIIGYK